MSSIEKELNSESIGHLDLPEPIGISPETTVRAAIGRMRDARRGDAIVVEGDRCVGILTEHDVLNKVVGRKGVLDSPVSEVMTRNPETLRRDCSIAAAIHRMHRGGYRNLPVVDDDGKVVAKLRQMDLVRFLVEHYPVEVYNLPPNPHQVNKAREGA